MLQNVLMMFTNVSLNNFLTHLLQKSISKLSWKHNTPKTALRELCLVLKVQVSLAPCGGFMEQYRRYIYTHIFLIQPHVVLTMRLYRKEFNSLEIRAGTDQKIYDKIVFT